MSSSTPSSATVLRVFDTLGPPGTPFTTPEIAAEFECSDRTIYSRLDALVEEGAVETKKVGARGRVWWQPVGTRRERREDAHGRRGQVRSHPVFDSELVGVIVWGDDVTIRDANDAFLEMAGLDYQEALGTSWRDLTPEEFYRDSERHIQQIEETGSGVPYEKQYYHADGGRWWGLFESRRLNQSEIVEFVVDVTERKEHEQAVRESEERLDAFVTATSDVVYRMSPDWSEMSFLDGREFIPDTDEPRQTWLEAYIPADEQPRVTEAVEEAIETRSTFELEHQVIQVDGTRGWTHSRAVPILAEDGDITEWFGTATDITERKRAEERLRENEAALERLNDASQDLIDAEPEAIEDRTATIVRSVLDVEYAALWRYDETAGELYEFASRTGPEIDPETVELPENVSEQVWQTFIGDDVDVDNDVEVAETPTVAPLRSRVLAPIGRHGVICAGSVRVGAFDEQRVDLVETVTATVETAWDRADGEAELERQNAELVRLDRINTLIREIDQALVQVETVDTIYEAVCDRLTESPTFEFAWIGEFEADEPGISPQGWAGIDATALESLTPGAESVPDESPFVTAVRTGEIQVVTDVATDPRAAPWREAALERGGRSCLCIPLTYDESVYGVLAVYGGTPRPDERDVDVLSELGQTIAYAIHAVETRATRRTDSVTELTLRTAMAETPLVRLSRELASVIEFQGLVPGSDGAPTLFFVAKDVSPDDVVAAADDAVTVQELIHLADRDDGSTFKAQLFDTTLAGLFLDRGATVRSLTIDGGTATAVVALSETADVRGFIQGIRREVPDIELFARRSRTRPIDTGTRLQTAFDDRLTPRQREVLHLAYRSGYFESPRVQTGKELSDALDISQSTFNHHLRGGERKLLDVVFDQL